MSVKWLPVRGYEGLYAVSARGDVKRVAGGRGATAGRLLRRYLARDGYRFVMLSKGDRKRTFGVHVLVAEAFIGPRPPRKFCNHKNLKKADNRACNLEWLTNRQNALHALRAGRRGGRPMRGEKNGNARLTRRQVAEVSRQKGRIGQRVLAALCGVSKTAIQKIHQGRAWPEDLRVREYPRG
jgi:hypothetical protein